MVSKINIMKFLVTLVILFLYIFPSNYAQAQDFDFKEDVHLNGKIPSYDQYNQPNGFFWLTEQTNSFKFYDLNGNYVRTVYLGSTIPQGFEFETKDNYNGPAPQLMLQRKDQLLELEQPIL